MKNLIKVVSVVLLMAVLTTGCAVNRATASVDAGAKLDPLKTFHVKRLEKDERGIDKLIAENLRTRGYQVTTGQQVPAEVDATVTYVDKWMWDITMYMIELTINFREPKTDFPLQAVVTKELSLYGSCSSAGEYPLCLDLISRNIIRVDPMISAKAPLADGGAWFSRLSARDGGQYMKIILQP